MRISAAFFVFLVLACGAEPSGDSFDASFAGPGGGADTFGVDEGSYLAAAVLETANTLGGNALDFDVGLNARTVDNMLEARRAAPFATLSELDDVPYVGPIAFERLVSYVEAEGLVGSCGDGVVQSNEACDGAGCSATCSARVEGGATSLRVSYRLVDHSEIFDGDDGWVYDDENEFAWVYEEEILVEALPVTLSTGNFSFSLRDTGLGRLDYTYGDADGSAEASVRFPMGGALLAGEPGTTYEISVAGGEHASGAWSCDGTVTLTLE